MSLSDPALALLLDPGRLSDLVQAPVHAAHLRHKVGVSTVAALLDPAGMPYGWIRSLTGAAVVKGDKARRRITQAGRLDQLGEARLTGRDTLVQWGPLATDPRLLPAVSVLDPVVTDVLRHNPLRRLVARHGELVVRVSVDPHRARLTHLVGDLAAAGVPVLTPASSAPQVGPRPRGSRLSWWPWVVGTDVAGWTAGPLTAQGELTLGETGRVLGLLHTADPSRVRGLTDRGWEELRAAALASVQLLEGVAPGPASTARGALERLPEQVPGAGPGVVCHGDLSLDQLLVRADTGEVLLTDLERAACAPAALDHASLLADELVQRDNRRRLAQIGAGYAEVTGRLPRVPGPWVGAALLARVAEPWRHQRPGWQAETVRRALLAGRVMTQGDLWPGSSRPVEVAG